MVGFAESRELAGATVLYRSELPPKEAQIRRQLEAVGAVLRPQEAIEDAHWCAEAEHPAWGRIVIEALEQLPVIFPSSVETELRLLDEERRFVRNARSSLYIVRDERPSEAPRERKLLLRFLHALLEEGNPHAAAYDFEARRVWSRSGLEDELAHDAPLDIAALMEVHAITLGNVRPPVPRRDGMGFHPPKVAWFHTHHLARIGGVDFEILRPGEHVVDEELALVRALACHLLEGTIEPGAPRVTAFLPRGEIALVDVDRFDAEAPPADRALRMRPPGEIDHAGPRRVVLCDPLCAAEAGKERTPGWRVRPARALQRSPRGDLRVVLPPGADARQRERARKTGPLLRELCAELAEFPIVLGQAIVEVEAKVAGEQRERLCLELRAFTGEERFEGVLLVAPDADLGHRVGDTLSAGFEELLSWRVRTPLGLIAPHELFAVRRFHRALPELRKALERDQGGRRVPRERGESRPSLAGLLAQRRRG
jgi:hypothetical protein